MRPRATGAGIGALRMGLGVALTVAPKLFLRGQPSAADPSSVLLARTVGVRDLALGLGTAVAASADSRGDLGGWIAIGLVSDVLDVVAASVHARGGEKRFVASALIPLPVIAADMWVLSKLRRLA